MSKRRTAKRAAKRVQPEDDTRVIITTSRGYRVACLPVGALIDQLRAQYEEKMPPVPAYTVTDAGGATVEVPHTADTIADDATSEEDKQAWIKYMTERLMIEAERDENILRALAIRGVEMLEIPDGWEVEHEWMGFELPETSHEKLYHYFITEIVSTEKDGLDILTGIYRATGMDEEVLAQIEESFRTPMGEHERADAATDTESSEAAEPAEA